MGTHFEAWCEDGIDWIERLKETEANGRLMLIEYRVRCDDGLNSDVWLLIYLSSSLLELTPTLPTTETRARNAGIYMIHVKLWVQRMTEISIADERLVRFRRFLCAPWNQRPEVGRAAETVRTLSALQRGIEAVGERGSVTSNLATCCLLPAFHTLASNSSIWRCVRIRLGQD